MRDHDHGTGAPGLWQGQGRPLMFCLLFQTPYCCSVVLVPERSAALVMAYFVMAGAKRDGMPM